LSRKNRFVAGNLLPLPVEYAMQMVAAEPLRR
jgi:hypothetical protein